MTTATTSTAATLPCPNGCARRVNATGKDIHLCIDRAAGIREYCATLDGQAVGYGFRTHHEALSALNERVLDLIEHGLIDTPLATLDAQPCIHCGRVQDRASCNDCVDWPEAAQALALDPQNDVCWSCGDQLSAPTHGPALCGACQEAGEQYPNIKPALHAALNLDTFQAALIAGLAADPQPAPPVDDGELDNWGGWRSDCANCGGAHHIQRCPEIWQELHDTGVLTVCWNS